MAAVGLAAVLDSVLEDDVGLTFVAPCRPAPFFCFANLVAPLGSWRDRGRDGETV